MTENLKLYPLSTAQQRFWLMTKFHCYDDLYNMSLGIVIHANLDFQKLETALNFLVLQQPSLRTTIHENDGEVFQQVKPKLINLPLRVIDNVNNTKGSLDKILNSEIQIKFNFEDGPLWRLSVIKISENKYYLFLVMHHVISDSWSFEIFFKELSKNYLGNDEKNSNDYFYTTFIPSEIKKMENPSFKEKAVNFWGQYLKDATVKLDLPFDINKSDGVENKDHVYSHVIKSDSYQKVQSCAKNLKCSVFNILLSAYAILLYRLTKSPNFVIGTMVAGRFSIEENNVIGCFANTLPLSFKLSSEDCGIIEYVKNSLLDVLNFQELPFQDIVNAYRANSGAFTAALFQTLFVFQNSLGSFDKFLSAENSLIDANDYVRTKSEFPLFILLRESNNNLHFNVHYNGNQFSEEMIAAICNDYQKILESLIESPYEKISSQVGIKEFSGVTGNINNKYVKNTEETICENSLLKTVSHIWKKVLKVDHIDEKSNFFTLGGHSLLVPQLQLAFKEELKMAIPIADFFYYPNLTDFASNLRKYQKISENKIDEGYKKTTDVKFDSKKSQPHLGQEDVEKPIAIIGLACRVDKVDTNLSFWQLLANGVSTVKKFEATALGKKNGYDNFHGSFLQDANKFDANFFRLSPREAEEMMPEQRIILELAWEALESSGYNIADFKGKKVGVFMGTMTNPLQAPLPPLTTHSLICNSPSFIPSRISYFFNFSGPSLSIETLCSSSLVALHLAIQSIRNRESNYALVGGIRIVIPAIHYEGSAMMKSLSVRGRCNTFDQKGDGFVPGEGGVVVVLKSLSDAQKDGDNILGIIKGSAVNHGGQGSGLTVPNAKAQSELVLSALKDAGVTADSISYIEAHGTGTELGDPIEILGLTQAFRTQTHRQQYCGIGSIKTNIGHTEPAAGLMGLAKVVLSLQEKKIPPLSNLEMLNSNIDFSDSPFYINDRLREWESEPGKPRRAGVSAFGIGGTNAHVILEEAPLQPKLNIKYTRTSEVFILSARTKIALEAYRKKMISHLEESTEDIASLCYSSCRGRSEFEHRLAVVGKDLLEIKNKLQTTEGKIALKGVFSGEGKTERKRKIAFLFTGQGSQYAGMGKALYDEEPEFKKMLNHCNELLAPHLDRSILEVMFQDGESIHNTCYTQPALFVLEYSLAHWLESIGVKADAFVGHSIGEYVAACFSGSISLEDALILVATRGRAMQNLPKNGAMAVVLASEKEVKNWLAGYENRLFIAAINSPRNITVSGDKVALEDFSKLILNNGIDFHPLQVSQAFHSPLIADSMEILKKAATEITSYPPNRLWISTLSGNKMTESPDSHYWIQQASSTVQFENAVHTLAEEGCSVFIEIGPQGILTRLAQQTLQGNNDNVFLTPLTLQENKLRAVLAELFAIGVQIDWRAYYRPFSPRYCPLPTYPFQRQDYPVSSQDLYRNMQATKKNYDSLPQKSDNEHITVASNTVSFENLDIMSILIDQIAEALKMPVDEVQIETPFLEMGADSLLLGNVLSLISNKFGIRVRMQQLFDEIETPDKLYKYILSSRT